MKVCVRNFTGELSEPAPSQVVVIDVLRATSVIVTALAHGALGVIPVAEVDEAFAWGKRCSGPIILGGERQNLPIPGFDCGNSPSDYRSSRVVGRTVILATTNGTRAIVAAKHSEARSVSIGALYNVGSLAAHLATIGEDVLLLCSGTEGLASLEDIVCAGALAQTLSVSGADLDDEAIMAAEVFSANEADVLGLVRRGAHARRLTEQGLDGDVSDVVSLNRYSVVPLLDGEIIKTRL